MKAKQNSFISRLIIIGLDGVPYHLIKDLAYKNIMPFTKSIIERGIFKKVESTIPEISSVAWSSIITGKNPGEHGIYGYTDIPIGTYRLSFPNYNNLKVPPFWELFPQSKAVIINVPSTFPVHPINGVHISGFVSLDLERSVYPKSLIPTLKRYKYKIDVDASKAHKSKQIFIKDLFQTLEARVVIYKQLWEISDWSTFMLVFTGTDRLAHFLWDTYEDDKNEYHDVFLDYFCRIDEIIGQIDASLADNDILIILSDHGFERLKQEININSILKKYGFLSLKGNGRRGYADIDEKTVAFALEPSRIYINYEGKYPEGKIKEKDTHKIRYELFSLFKEFSFNGRRIAKRILNKEEIYKGQYLSIAPDIVLVPEECIGFKASLKTDEIIEESIFTGKHTQDNAFFILKSNDKSNIDQIIPLNTVVDIGALITIILKKKIKNKE